MAGGWELEAGCRELRAEGWGLGARGWRLVLRAEG